MAMWFCIIRKEAKEIEELTQYIKCYTLVPTFCAGVTGNLKNILTLIMLKEIGGPMWVPSSPNWVPSGPMWVPICPVCVPSGPMWVPSGPMWVPSGPIWVSSGPIWVTGFLDWADDTIF
ncbi:hypothetical protein AVEN_146618-1 [Araneus ventricosus]|uniref:Uncharacterized protein n=1 Tax=Araneus ventricosus TaxID=182803 RepID=A0A4Y2F0I7_ARAVE|nr:hypothetical protein AVEN_146618-1 [Araneus ventricosus]